MEKIKYLSFALIVAICAGFISCSDDDEEETTEVAKIFGLWQGNVAKSMYWNGRCSFSGNYGIRFDIKEHGTYVRYEKNEVNNNWIESGLGTWHQDYGRFVIYENDDKDNPVVFNIIEHSASKLVMEDIDNYQYEDDYGGVHETKYVVTLFKM